MTSVPTAIGFLSEIFHGSTSESEFKEFAFRESVTARAIARRGWSCAPKKTGRAPEFVARNANFSHFWAWEPKSAGHFGRPNMRQAGAGREGIK